MATGIPLLDSIINGVNQAVNTVQTMANNAVQITANPVNQAAIQLGNYIGQMSNAVGGVVSGINNQLYPNSTSYQTVSYNPPNSSYVPYQVVPSVGQALQAPGTVYQQNTYPVTYGTGFNAPQNVNANISLQGFDFNTVYSAVNAAFASLPSIVNAIQNPLNNPYTSQLVQLLNNLYNQQAGTVDLMRQFITNAEQSVYQSASNTLRGIGIDVGQWSNVLDATVRTVMQELGYSQEQQFKAISDMVKDGNAQQANAIFAVQNGINSFLQKLDVVLNGQTDLLKTLANPKETTTTTPQQDIINNAIADAGSELSKVLAGSIDKAFNSPEGFFKALNSRIDDISTVIDDLKAGKFHSTEEFFSAIFGNQPATGLARGLIILASVIPTLISAVNMAGEPALDAFGQLVQQDSPVKLLSPSDYLTAYFKKAISFDYMKDKLAKQGINEEQMTVLLNASVTDPDFGTMIQAKRRGFITDKEWKDYIEDQRLDAGSREIIEQVMNILPNPQDLTRIADKRIWGLNLPEKYGQYTELPDNYIKYMGQQGYDEQFTKWFWAAHWELPSPNQIFEMYQRHVINYEDMQAYLALTDWLPFFRDKLLAISYNPLTRVDIRRMYGLGMFNHDELIKRYEAIGFSPDDSALMARFTELYESQTGDNELEKLQAKIVTAVERLYVTNKITRDEAVNRLMALGKDRQIAELSLNYLEYEKTAQIEQNKLQNYQTRAIKLIIDSYKKANYGLDETIASLVSSGLSESEAREEIKYADIERAVQTKSDIITVYETRYINGVDAQSVFIANLSQAGLSVSEINQELTEAELKLQKRFKMPSEKQVQTWYANGTVDYSFVIPYLKALGYPESIIPLVLAGDYPPTGA